MRRHAGWLVGLLLVIRPVSAAEPQGRLVLDNWNTATLDGGKAGFIHTTVRELERNGGKLYRATTELRLTIQRDRQEITLRMESGTEETADGKVTGVFMRQFQGNQLQLSLNGTVQNNQLSIQVAGMIQKAKVIAWNDDVVGLYHQERLYQERKVKPGDKFSFLSFDPTLNTVVTNQVLVKDYEEVKGPKGQKQSLLRVETSMDPIQTPDGPVQLPGLTLWLDKDRQAVRTQFELPLLGTLVLQRATQAEAVGQGPAPAAGKLGPDIIFKSLIPLNRPISDPNGTRSAVYRITLAEDKNAATAFAQDERQQRQNLKGQTFELHVHALRDPHPAAKPAAIKGEFRRSCYWIDSDNALIRRYAHQAVGEEIDPWTKAKKIERWVRNHMSISSTEPFAQASVIARSLRGDCRQHAFLATALCRAAGVPARTAVGLVYADDRRRGPVMAFHMWTEVAIDGQWLALDATRGEGSVGATHLKITDHSWANTQTLTPLLPVVRVLAGKPVIEVVRVDEAE